MSLFGKKRRIENQVKGLCACGEPPRLGKKSCEGCARRIRAESEKYKKLLRKKKICLHCMVNEASLEKTLCVSCLKKANEKGKKRYRSKTERHMCLTCPRPAVDGNHCADCAVKVRENDRKRSKGHSNLYAKEHMKQGLCINCPSPCVEGRKDCSKCNKKKKIASQLNRFFLKEKVLAHYGKACNWPDCDVSDFDLLTVDHINNDGSKDRAPGICRRVIKADFPDTFQVLCWNHQWKKRMISLRKRIPFPEVIK